MEFDFSSETANRHPNRIPPRFALSSTQSESQKMEGSINKAELPHEKNVNGEIPRRRIQQNPCKDGSVVYTKESALVQMIKIYPKFSSLEEIMVSKSKWNEKVESFEELISFIQSNSNNLATYSEALLCYSLIFTSQFKASNINILKSGLESIKVIITECGAGPRACEEVIKCLIPKIHDKKLGPEICSILSLISETIGPDSVIEIITMEMNTSKVPLQQKSVLQWLQSVIEDFGASNVNLKSFLVYLKKPQALLSSNPDVKTAATSLVCELYHQLGNTVMMLIEQFALPELQLKSIRSAVESIEYDPSLVALYNMSHTATVDTAYKPSSSTVVSTLNLLDLADPCDVTSELSPLLNQLRETEGKESWKIRQDAVITVTALLDKKKPVVNNAAVAELANCLKDRLGETNLNLRTKVVFCIGRLATAVGPTIANYTNMMIPELLKLSGDSKASVVDALFVTLTQWIQHNGEVQPSILNAILHYIVIAFKTPKGRQETLRWLRDYISYGDEHQLNLVISGVLDGALDKTKETRSAASDVLEVLCRKCGKDTIRCEIDKRRTADIQQLNSVLLAVSADTSPQQPIVYPSDSDSGVNSGKDTLSTSIQRRDALAKRPGVRLLSKRKMDADGKPVSKFNITSSIPKPSPMRSTARTERDYGESVIDGLYEETADEVGQEESIPVSVVQSSPHPLKQIVTRPVGPSSPQLMAQPMLRREKGTSAPLSVVNDVTNRSENVPSTMMLPALRDSILFENDVSIQDGCLSQHTQQDTRVSFLSNDETSLLVKQDNLSPLPRSLGCGFNTCPIPSLFVNNFSQTLHSVASSLFHFVSISLFTSLCSDICDDLEQMCHQITRLLAPKCEVISTEPDVPEDDKESVLNRADFWMAAVANIIQKMVKYGLCDRFPELSQSLLNSLCCVFSQECENYEISHYLSADCLICIISACITIICNDGANANKNDAVQRVRSSQRILVSCIIQCSPSELLYAILIYINSQPNFSTNTSMKMIVNRILKRLFNRLSMNESSYMVSREDINIIKSRIPKNCNEELKLLVDKCYYCLQPMENKSTDNLLVDYNTVSSTESYQSRINNALLNHTMTLDKIVKKSDNERVVKQTPSISDTRDRLQSIREKMKQLRINI